MLATPEEASRQLYDVLHRCDLLGVRSIIVRHAAGRARVAGGSRPARCARPGQLDEID